MNTETTATSVLIQEGFIRDVGKKELKDIAPGNLEWTEKGLKMKKENHETN